MTEYRARLSGDVALTNGGVLSVREFLVDVPAADVSPDELGDLLVSSFGVLMAGEVVLREVTIVEAAHTGTRGGPSSPARAASADQPRRLVELNHVITEGMVTYPGLPAPQITPFLTRADSRSHYTDGTEFALDCITLIGNTGTYLDSPYHRYDHASDLAGLALAQLVELPTVVMRVADSEQRAIDAATLAAIDDEVIAGSAVLLHTGGAARFGTPEYAQDAGYLTRDGAHWLVERAAALVGIDSVNIDAIEDGARPAHSVLLAAGIPIVEHLTGLEQLPPFGARFSAVPPRLANFGTFPVRAFASVPA